jgi:hypothetical protein
MIGRGSGTGCGGSMMISTPCPNEDPANRKKAQAARREMRFIAAIL